MLAFYRRRAYRILPAYWAVLLLYAAVPLWRESPGMWPVWQFLTFTRNLLVVDYPHHMAFSQAWSLCVEEHFYLILPLLTVLLMRRPAAWKVVCAVALLVLAGMAIRWYLLVHTLRPLARAHQGFALAYLQGIYYPTYTRLDGLVAGIVLAVIRLFRPAWWRRIEAGSHALLAAGLLLTGVALWLFSGRFTSVTGASAAGTLAGFPLLALGFTLLLASSLSPRGLLSRYAPPGARGIAILAFSLYLTHKEAVHLVQHFLPVLTSRPGILTIAVEALACFAVASALYLGVERPFMLLRDRRGRRKPVEVEAEVEAEPAL